MRQTLFCLLVVVAHICFGQTSTGQLVGTVEDPNGAPVEQVCLRVQHWSLDNPNRKAMLVEDATVTRSDQGRFKVDLPPGIYDVFLSAPSFEPVARSVKIKVGKETQLRLKLKSGRYVTFVE